VCSAPEGFSRGARRTQVEDRVLSTRRISRVADISAQAWDALVGDDDPFVEHAFLDDLEQSRSVGRGTGWVPMHVIVSEGHRVVGALPLYEKDDSWGEFIFDFQWARAAQAARIRYYPKLVSMVPFTPATGRRFLVHPDADRAAVVTALLDGAVDAAKETRASSLHLLYLDAHEREEALAHRVSSAEGGFTPRLSLQFHWENQGYRDFEHYLEGFRAPSRKQVKKERRVVAEQGVEVRVVRGTELTEREWQALEVFYRLNVARHGSFAYLQPPFFAHLRAHHAHRVLAVIAYEHGEPIAGSINFEKGKHLYGRYWGSTVEHEMLHFECCYYRLIDHAIREGHTRFEAGAQGHHKLKRGLLPSDVHSVHWMADPRLAMAVREFCAEEAAYMRREIEEVLRETPFKRG
jgi:predicted N-acyltransferase